MKDYKATLDVLEPLDELQEDILLDEMYLKALALLNDSKLSEEEKSCKLLEIYKKSSRLTYMIFEYLFKVNPKIAWDNFDLCKSELLTEVLWKIDLKDLNLDIISNNEYLKDLYSARGDVKYSQVSSVFELDVLIKLKGRVNATLSFEYVCSSCKGTYPFAFNRCSSCHAIDTAMVEYTLSKDYVKEYSEENNSFQ
jgi:hypothetical protein